MFSCVHTLLFLILLLFTKCDIQSVGFCSRPVASMGLLCALDTQDHLHCTKSSFSESTNLSSRTLCKVDQSSLKVGTQPRTLSKSIVR